MKKLNLILVFFLLITTGCSGLPGLGETPSPNTVQTPTLLPLPTLAQPDDTPSVQPSPAGPVTLRIWVPPQFDPYAGTEAGDLLLARLEEFAALRPRVRLDIRVKALQDPGGILDALSTTSAAAPLALPDMLLLPRPLMEAAALKGLLHPLDDLTTALEAPDWYDYASQLGRLQNSTFGMPFAGDVMIMVYRPDMILAPPGDWSTALDLQSPLAFPAADPQALFTLAMYQSAGGAIQDEQGRPTLSQAQLANILSLYQAGEAANLIPLWLTQIETDDQVWEAYLAGRAPMMVTWAAHFLQNTPENSSATLPPSPDGVPFTLATGWVWSMASAQNEKRELVARLFEYLTEPEFLAEWNLAAGFLPPRATALELWPPELSQSFSTQILQSASLIPSTDILSSLSPLLKTASIQVIKKQGEPQALAEEALSHLVNP